MSNLTTIRCPHCQGLLRIDRAVLGGKKIRCGRCQGICLVPALPARPAESRKEADTERAAPRQRPGVPAIFLGSALVLLIVTVGVSISMVLAAPRPGREPIPEVRSVSPVASGLAATLAERDPSSGSAVASGLAATLAERDPSPAVPQPEPVNVAEPLPVEPLRSAAPRPALPVQLPSATAQEPAGPPRVSSPAVPVSAVATQPPAPAPATPTPATPAPAPAPATAAPMPPVQPLTPLEKKAAQAIRQGIAYFRQTQNADGSWGSGGYAVGYTALPGLALLECGIPPEDAAVQKAARFVRQHSQMLATTYELSLAVLFLDRLSDPRDTPLIRTLAARLIAGQNGQGGWSYHCPLLTPQEETQLLTYLKKNTPPPRPEPLRPQDFPNLVTLPRPLPNPLESQAKLPDPLQKPGTPLPTPLEKDIPEILPIPLEWDRQRMPIRLPATSPTPAPVSVAPSNPTTPAPQPAPANQPALPALTQPASPLPASPAPQAAAPVTTVAPAKPPVKGKGKGNAGWAAFSSFSATADRPEFLQKALPTIRDARMGKGGKRDDNSNTHFAILALWAARRHDIPMALPLSLLDQRFRTSQFPDGSWGYRYAGPGGSRPSMTAVGMLGLGIGHGSFREAWTGSMTPMTVKGPPMQDPAIQKGLRALAQDIGSPSGKRGGGGVDLYFLWTVERVAVLYGLETIGGRDWYAWGAQVLLDQQQKKGSWATGSFNGSSETIDTAMALLFLRRGNLLHDLTVGLRPFVAVRDLGAGR